MNGFGSVSDDEWLLIRIYPGAWDEPGDRPWSSEFKVNLAREAGKSAYRASVRVCRRSSLGPPRTWLQPGRLKVADIRALGLFVIVDEDEDEDEASIGHAHAEIRAGSPEGGNAITRSA